MSCKRNIICYDPFNQFITTCNEFTIVNSGIGDFLGTIFMLDYIPELVPNEDVILPECKSDFNICDFITSWEIACLVQFEQFPIFPLKISNYIYYIADPFSLSITETEGSILVGFILEDYNNNPIILGFEEDYCTANICITRKSEINENIYDFKLRILSLQCQYSKQVLEYTNDIKYGAMGSNCLSELKTKMNVLKLLNEYDVRDILEEETVYNSLTFDQISKLLNKI